MWTKYVSHRNHGINPGHHRKNSTPASKPHAHLFLIKQVIDRLKQIFMLYCPRRHFMDRRITAMTEQPELRTAIVDAAVAIAERSSGGLPP